MNKEDSDILHIQEEDAKKLAMYFMVLDSTPDNMVPVICAHGSLMCYWKFDDKLAMIAWKAYSFKKRICRVNDSEFAKAKEYGDFVEVRESSLGEDPVALVFAPRLEWPNAFKYAKLWKPKDIA